MYHLLVILSPWLIINYGSNLIKLNFIRINTNDLLVILSINYKLWKQLNNKPNKIKHTDNLQKLETQQFKDLEDEDDELNTKLGRHFPPPLSTLSWTTTF